MRNNTINDNAELLEEIRKLSKSVAELKGERDSIREEVSLADRVKKLQKEISDLEIDKAKITEDHARKERETTHMVGLERKRQQFEAEQATKGIETAKQEAVLAVREENLKADKDRFTDEVKFTRERFESEVGYLKELMVEVLGRLPSVSVDKKITVGARAVDEDDD